MKQIVETDQPLLEVLKALSPESSKNTLKSWVEKGRVTVNGYVVKHPQKKVVKGAEVAVGQRVEFAEEGIKILYEDGHIVVVEKPDKLLSVATDSGNERSVHSILKGRKKGLVFPVHRLDRETSGVMLFAYTEAARDRLKEMFEAHDLTREYYALVEGIPSPRSGTWKSHLIEDASYRVRSANEGKIAITHYEVVGVGKKLSSVRFRLETGRKNQIRVHASEAGHPIVGDKKYGASIFHFKRLCLHAYLLEFSHPVTGKAMKFVSALPQIFKI